MNNMKSAFEKTEIKSLILKNRFVRSATWEGLADSAGRVTDGLVDMFQALAAGGVGLAITGFAYIRTDGQAAIRQTGIYADDLADDLKRLTGAVHQAGGRVAMQIVHAGIQAPTALTGMDIPAGPSSVNHPAIKIKARELSISEILDLVEDFGRAAARVKAAGFDAVQIHAAHGYLLSQFLSPAINRRGDRYGGRASNRARALYETYEAVRGAVGPDYPVLVKINAADFIDGGLEKEESLSAAANLEAMGLDAFEVSAGLPWSGRLNPVRTRISEPEKEAYFRNLAAAFKARLQTPVIMVGGLRSPGVIGEVLEQGQADYVSLARPFIREPALVQRWAEGDPAPAKCISCNGCFQSAASGEGIFCVQEKKNQAR